MIVPVLSGLLTGLTASFGQDAQRKRQQVHAHFGESLCSIKTPVVSFVIILCVLRVEIFNTKVTKIFHKGHKSNEKLISRRHLMFEMPLLLMHCF
jgi:fucose permease